MQEEHIYLLEDALDLWWSLLQSAPSSSAELMSLLPCAFTLLDHDTENLRKVLKIIDSYILLDPTTTLQPANAAILFEKLAGKIVYCREQAASYITHTIDLALQGVPLQAYGESLVQSGLLSNILSILIQDKVIYKKKLYIVYIVCFNIFLTIKIYGYAIVNYMNLFARLSIYDANFVIQVIQLTGQQQQMPGDFLGDIMDKWLDKVPEKKSVCFYQS